MSFLTLARSVRASGFSRILSQGRTISAGAGSSSEASSASPQEQDAPSNKLVIFGGRGFVGSHVCKEALSTGMHIMAISRGGTPPPTHEPWTKEVEWLKGNALEPQTYAHHLKGAAAVISCIGGFGNQEQMMKVNGTANIDVIRASKEAGVPRFVFVSATIPPVPGIGMVLGGYIKGKAAVEAAIMEHYPDSGVYLRPSIIYGNRVISQNLTLPLQYLFKPIESGLKMCPDEGRKFINVPFLGALFLPPVSAEAVACAAVRAATDPSVPPGCMDVYQVQEHTP